ncbi:MAG: DUF4271 domain-containing protein [Sphingobacteriales bacterium]
MRFTFFCFLLISCSCLAVYARQDTVAAKGTRHLDLAGLPSPDSAAMAKASRQKFMEDSIAMIYIVPDSMRENQFISSIYKNNFLGLFSHPAPLLKHKTAVISGKVRNSRDPWIIAVVLGLFTFTALLNLFLSKDIKSVLQSFYNKNALSQVDKEGGLINSWAFIGLFLLFCLTSGLVLYQLTVYRSNNSYTLSGFQLFMWFSLIIGLLSAVKFIVLKFIGFVFDVNRMVSEYIAVLNLTYFNFAFVFLSVGLCFSLLASRFIPQLLTLTLVLMAVIFTWQYMRNSLNVISNFRFHKFYLFIYLCALEICPVLILIKAINI